jgi:hypothetical protein
MNAVIARLDGVVYDGPDGRLEIRGVVVDDRGRNSAESRHGADFSISASIQCADGSSIYKAVLGQAKRGTIESLPRGERIRLETQISKMGQSTRHYIVTELPLCDGAGLTVRASKANGHPGLRSGKTFGSYLSDVFLACTHGDKRPNFWSAVGDSRLPGLQIICRS